jgi:hypothetical protein
VLEEELKESAPKSVDAQARHREIKRLMRTLRRLAA